MNNVSGSFYIDMIVDGDSAQGNIRSTKPLVQMYNPSTKVCVPDWTVAANQPMIYPVIRSGNENVIKPVVTGSEKWYYNGVQITFDESGLSTAPSNVSGLFQKSTTTYETVQVPVLKIVGNLANGSNMDADTIRLDGQIEASGHALSFSTEIPVAISEYTDSAYYGFIYVTNGGIIDDNHQSVTLTQELYSAGEVVPQSAYTVRWRQLHSGGWSTDNSLTVRADQIDSKASYICEFFVDGVSVASYIQEVSDESDPYFVTVNWNGSTTLQPNATVIGTIKVKKVGTGVEQSGWTFSVLMTKRDGTDFAPETAVSGATVTLTYNDVSNAGGSITGYIMATKS